MRKVDLKKELKHLYGPSTKEVSVVDVPPMNFLMIDGQGDPNTSREYAEALEALYAVSYAIKFNVKRSKDVDYTVMPLEGLWWTDDMSQFSVEDKGSWKWTATIMQPEEFVTEELFEEVKGEVEKKKGLSAIPKMRFEVFREGLSAQIMHLGPFSEEGPTIERIHRSIEKLDGEPRGKHHEIYLSDFRRTKAERLRTVIRQAVKRPSRLVGSDLRGRRGRDADASLTRVARRLSVDHSGAELVAPNSFQVHGLPPPFLGELTVLFYTSCG